MNAIIRRREAHLLAIRIAVAVCILACIFNYSELSADSFSQRFRVQVRLSSFESGLSALSDMGYDIAGFNESNSTVLLVVNQDEYYRLADMGYNTQILPEAKPFKRSSMAPAIIQQKDAAKANIVIDDGYHSFEQVESILRQFQATFPEIVQMVGIGVSHYGRTVWAMKVSDNVGEDEDEPAIMFNAMHHARELMSTEVVLDTLNYLTTNYGRDPDVTRWVNNWEIWLIPVVNPDGLDIIFTRDTNWRKNARDNNHNGIIDNGDGVDINRNYPFKWGLTPGSSGVPSDSTYRGPSAASEPEVQAIIDLSLRKRFVFSIAYHTSGGVVLFPYGSQAATNPSPNISGYIGSDIAKLCVREDNRQFDLKPRLYDVNGLDRDWHYHNGTIGFVIELGVHGFQPDYDRWRDAIVEGIRPGWQYLLNRIDSASIYGHVTDAKTSTPVGAIITVDEIKYFEGELRTSDPNTGMYHRIFAPGTYSINFWAAGYLAQSFRVKVEDELAFNLEVALQTQEDASVSEAEEIEIQKDVPATSANTTVLLQNYPNPFNPVTWIPFVLSEPAEVTLSIYDLRGVLTRRLDLGYRGAGAYVRKDKAALWDGKNESGEQAASGVYFYTIQAGDYKATKRMTISR